VSLMLAGRFKREVGEKFVCQPLACKSSSGDRTIEIMNKSGIVDGPLPVEGKANQTFKKATLGGLDPSFLQVLKRGAVQVAERDPQDCECEHRGRTQCSPVIETRSNVTRAREVIKPNNRRRKKS
jgi:hypothetical protein